MKYLYYILLLIFCIYWTVTFALLLPKNPISIKGYKFNNAFQTIFFQNWSFFAPPPKYNQHVFVVVKNKKNQKDVFEIVTPILRKKSELAPFNNKYQILDYVIASSVINIDGNIRMYNDLVNYNNHNISDSIKTIFVVNQIEKTNDFKSLKRYAEKILLNQNYDFDSIEFQIQLEREYLPQYADRFSNQRKSEITFSSNYLKLIE